MRATTFFIFFRIFFFQVESFSPSFFLYLSSLLFSSSPSEKITLTLTMKEKASIALTLSRVTAKTWTSPTRRCKKEAPPSNRTGAGVPPLPLLLVAAPPRPPPNLEETAPPRPPVRIWLRKAAGRAGLFFLKGGGGGQETRLSFFAGLFGFFVRPIDGLSLLCLPALFLSTHETKPTHSASSRYVRAISTSPRRDMK